MGLSEYLDFSRTRLKCKSSARVKIVLKKDWIVKKVFKSWKKKSKNGKKFFEKFGKIRKIRKKIIRNNQKNNQ